MFTSSPTQLTFTGWAATAVGSDVDVTERDSGITERAVLLPLGSIITVDWAATFEGKKVNECTRNVTAKVCHTPAILVFLPVLAGALLAF